MNFNLFRRRPLAAFSAAFVMTLTLGFGEHAEGIEPFRGWAPLKTRPLSAKWAIPPSKAVYPQPLVTIPPNPTPYPYGYFGAVGPHSNVQAGPGSSPGTGAWSYSFRR